MWYILLALLLALLFVVLIRTLKFKPTEEVRAVPDPVSFDKERAINHLQQLIRCKTVSYKNHDLEDKDEFEKLRNLLPDFYPNVFKNCTMERVDQTGILFHWKGKDSNEPSVMMAHYDVVPVDESGWEKDPFEGIIENGILWGRGTLDTKITFCSSLEAAETLLEQGFVPEHDIYLAYSGDEEISGNGAPSIVSLLKDRGITPGMVVDEGGAVVENVFPGVKEKTALIGIGEKGIMEMELSVRSNGGHASAPLPHGPVSDLARAVVALEDHPFRSQLCGPSAAMFDTLGRRSTFLYRMIFANLWCFKPVLDMFCKKAGGELNAMMRTTCAFTQMKGSAANNVIPPKASVGMNLRLIGEDTVKSVVDYVRKTINNEKIEINVLAGDDPSPTSDVNTDGWRKIKKAVEQTWEDAIVSPYLMVQCSDSRHYNQITDKIYKFSAMELTKEERSSIHGNNERIPLEKIGKAVEFYLNLERQC